MVVKITLKPPPQASDSSDCLPVLRFSLHLVGRPWLIASPQLSVAAAVATALNHSAQRQVPVVEEAREGVVREEHHALRGQTRPLLRMRPERMAGAPQRRLERAACLRSRASLLSPVVSHGAAGCT